MKASDLRCGNLVYKVIEDFEPCNPKTHTWSESDWYSISECVCELDWFKPIPLNEEWLVKFGFIRGEHNWFNIKYFTDSKESVEVMKIDYNLMSKRLSIYDAIEETDMANILSHPIYTAKRIEYVHQLQNLYYALTNEELTLNK